MIIAIEGNIGSGKSTVLNTVQTTFGECVKVYPEPVHEWRDVLQAYYADPKDNAFRLACQVLLSFISPMPLDRSVHVFERMPATSKNVFAAMNRNDGDMRPREWEVLCKMHDDLAWDADLVIFVDTPSHVCCQRILQRARQCEEAMTTQYVRRVEHAYSKFIDSLPPGRVIKVDGARPVEEVAAAVCDIVRACVSRCR